ncbi:hypothetical protein [Krasilnikovia sp. MM14-A1004]|uniref:hypothetical protein n=1 Tax=Krasilnikovia sp. MM14-A1004 TaxID=3373541 RepID=UPI00399CC2C0
MEVIERDDRRPVRGYSNSVETTDAVAAESAADDDPTRLGPQVRPEREMSETEYLLAHPANAERLRRSLEELNAGRAITFDSIEDMIRAAAKQRAGTDLAMQCLVCGATLQDNGMSTWPREPSEGVIVQIPGNYGSTVYDPPGDLHLVAYLCDPCLAAKAQVQIILEVEVTRRDPHLTITSWQPERND